ncbi:unnamed protein product [Microthlaspi erraticum]|uniref:PIK-related kinase FAT domain-containing protein n=1 Tax=Microthlaspi erraticum TaxID=1685480 RepID=A0A6D2LG86_9BRAS|nr:unnamed protein product [Microthlaspi erraticum]
MRYCPPTTWDIRSLLELLDLPGLGFHLRDCFRAVLDALNSLDKTVRGQREHSKDESIHTSKRPRLSLVVIADGDEWPPRLREHIEEVLANADYLSGPHGLMKKDRVKDFILRMKHDSPYVRLLLTCELRTFLHTSQGAGELISDMEIWNSLITSLLQGCAEDSGTRVGHRLQLACAECLGSIGAIDPAKVRSSSANSSVTKFDDDTLIFESGHVIFGASRLGAEVGNCWLQYAKLCRLAGHYETAHMAILKAQDSGAPNVHMEKAKLLWITRDSGSAIAELRQSLLNMPEGVVDSSVISSITGLLMSPTNTEPIVGSSARSLSDKKRCSEDSSFVFKMDTLQWAKTKGRCFKSLHLLNDRVASFFTGVTDR